MFNVIINKHINKLYFRFIYSRCQRNNNYISCCCSHLVGFSVKTLIVVNFVTKKQKLKDSQVVACFLVRQMLCFRVFIIHVFWCFVLSHRTSSTESDVSHIHIYIYIYKYKSRKKLYFISFDYSNYLNNCY